MLAHLITFININKYIDIHFLSFKWISGLKYLFSSILGIIFPIIGTVKAANGILWKYPLSIPFFSISTNETSEELLDDELVDNFNKK